MMLSSPISLRNFKATEAPVAALPAGEMMIQEDNDRIVHTEFPLSSRKKRQRAAKHGINVLKSFLGSNYLSIPFAVAAAGSLFGPLLIAIIAFISGFGCLLLVRIRKDLLRQHRQIDVNGDGTCVVETYAQVAGVVLGSAGYYVVEAFLILTQAGYCIGYVIYMSTALRQFTGASLSQQVITFGLLFPSLVCLCLVPDLKHFLPFSFASNIALLMGFLAIIAACISHARAIGTFDLSWGISDIHKIPLAFGNIVASFEGIGTILSVEGSMAKDQSRETYPPLLRKTLLLVTLLFSLFGIVGLGAYGEELCSVILNNISRGAYADAARGCLIVGLFFTYGFQMYPVFEMIDLRLFPNEGPDHASFSEVSPLLTTGDNPSLDISWESCGNDLRRHRMKMTAKYVGVRVGLVLTTSIIAYFVPEFELLVALIGSVGAGMLAFVVPGILGLVLYRNSALFYHKLSYISLIILGVVGGSIGAAYALHDLIQGYSQC